MKKSFLILVILAFPIMHVSAESTESSVSQKKLEKLFSASEGIYVAEFKSYEYRNAQSFPVATYRYTNILKGPPFGSSMTVRYDLKASASKQSRREIAKLMPEVNSKWILFFPTLIRSNGLMKTTQGAYGRVHFTEANLGNLLSVMNESKYKNQTNSVSAQSPDYRGIVVFSSKRIKKGQFFSKDVLEIRDINQNNTSSIDISSYTQLLERRAARTIEANQRITQKDILLADVNKWTSYDELDSQKKPKPGNGRAVYAMQDIFKGCPIALPSVAYGEDKIKNISAEAVKSRKKIIGKHAKESISKGQLITNDMIEISKEPAK